MTKPDRVRTTFDIPGKPMDELAAYVKKNKRQQVLIAFQTEVYASGPSVDIRVGWIELDNNVRGIGNCVTVGGRPHAMAFEDFQCWWPLPQAAFSTPKVKR